MIQMATTCYIEQDGKTLLLYRNKKEDDEHRGWWLGLGGKIKPGESPDECVVREVKEESGLTVHDPQLRAILTFPAERSQAVPPGTICTEGNTLPESPSNAFPNWYVFVYTATDYDGELQTCSEGELHWVPNGHVTELVSEGDRLFWDWLTRYPFFSAKIVYKDGKLVDYALHVHDSPPRDGM